MRRMRLLALSSLALLVVAAGCGGGSSSSSSSGGPAATIDKTPVTITMWDLWSGEEGKPFNDNLKGFTKKYPWITVKQIVQPNTPNDTFDPNLVNAINGGNAPDVAMPFGPDYIGQYCSSGLWQDLTPYMQADQPQHRRLRSGRDHLHQLRRQAVRAAVADRRLRPLLQHQDAPAGRHRRAAQDHGRADGRRQEADRAQPGRQHQGGRVRTAQPVGGAGAGRPRNAWGAKWFDDQNKAVLGTDPGWASALRWQKQLIDWYGYDNITKFFAANTNNEFNTSNAFQKGKVAMTFDGEWRTAFIKRGAPNLQYGTAPFPADASHPDQYGSSRVGGTIVGIPKGAKHPDQAWLLVKYLASDTNYLVNMANAVGNVPTTKAVDRVSRPDAAAPVQAVPAGLGQPQVGIRTALAGRRRRIRRPARHVRRRLAVRQDPGL